MGFPFSEFDLFIREWQCSLPPRRHNEGAEVEPRTGQQRGIARRAIQVISYH
jgi:hypothetical protein